MTDGPNPPSVRLFSFPETGHVVVGSTGTANIALGTAIWSGKELPHQPPKEHPIYSLIGQVAAAWAQVDHLLDILIWQLADVDPQAGACITAQIPGTYGRFKAVIALLQFHQQRTNKPLQKLINRATDLSNKSNIPGEGRHRTIHDPWYQYPAPVDTAQFRAMPHKDPIYGIAPVDLKEIETKLDEIRQFTERLQAFRADVLDALVTK
jgi:hypothetical protein